jgi:pre-mRNA-splicing factor ISY1
MRKEVVEEWHRVEQVRREAMKNVVSGEVVTAGGHSGEAAREVLFEGVEEERKREEEEREKVKEAGREFVSHVPLPDEEIERMVLERKKKKELLSKYASDSLQVEQEEAKEMLNVRH